MSSGIQSAAAAAASLSFTTEFSAICKLEFNKEIQKLAVRIDALNADILSSQASFTSLNSNIETRRAAILPFKTDYENKNTDLKKKEADLRDKLKEQQTAETSISDSDDNIMMTSVDCWNRNADSGNYDLSKLKKIKDFIDNILTLQPKKTSLIEESDLLSKQIKALKAELAAKKAAYEQIVRQLNELNAEAARPRDLNLKLEGDKKALSEETVKKQAFEDAIKALDGLVSEARPRVNLTTDKRTIAIKCLDSALSSANEERDRLRQRNMNLPNLATKDFLSFKQTKEQAERELLLLSGSLLALQADHDAKLKAKDEFNGVRKFEELLKNHKTLLGQMASAGLVIDIPKDPTVIQLQSKINANKKELDGFETSYNESKAKLEAQQGLVNAKQTEISNLKQKISDLCIKSGIDESRAIKIIEDHNQILAENQLVQNRISALKSGMAALNALNSPQRMPAAALSLRSQHIAPLSITSPAMRPRIPTRPATPNPMPSPPAKKTPLLNGSKDTGASMSDGAESVGSSTDTDDDAIVGNAATAAARAAEAEESSGGGGGGGGGGERSVSRVLRKRKIHRQNGTHSSPNGSAAAAGAGGIATSGADSDDDTPLVKRARVQKARSQLEQSYSSIVSEPKKEMFEGHPLHQYIMESSGINLEQIENILKDNPSASASSSDYCHPMLNQSVNGWSPLLLLAYKGQMDVMIDLLKKHKIKTNSITNDNWNILQLMCMNANFNKSGVGELIELLRNSGLKLNEPAKNLPLHLAAQRAYQYLIDGLLMCGADRYMYSLDGFAAVHHIITADSVAAFRAILKKGNHKLDIAVLDMPVKADGELKGKNSREIAEIVGSSSISAEIEDIDRRRGFWDNPNLPFRLTPARVDRMTPVAAQKRPLDSPAGLASAAIAEANLQLDTAAEIPLTAAAAALAAASAPGSSANSNGSARANSNGSASSSSAANGSAAQMQNGNGHNLLETLFNVSVGYSFENSPDSMTNVKKLTSLLIKKRFDSLGKFCGKALDNGDCFYHAFAQALNVHRKKAGQSPVTIVELRKQAAAAMKDPRVEKHWTKGVSDPVWGRPTVEGKTLCKIYSVNMKIFTADILPDDSGEGITGEMAKTILESTPEYLDRYLTNPERCMFGPSANDSCELSPVYPTIEIVGSRMHFMPVFNKG